MFDIIKQNKGSILIALIELVLGIVLLINGQGFSMTIIRIIGAVLLVRAALSLYNYIKAKPADAVKSNDLLLGLVLAGAGIFSLLKPELISTAFPSLHVIYGILEIVLGLIKVQSCVNKLRTNVNKWYFELISAIVTLGLAALLFVNLIKTYSGKWIFLGVSFIVIAVLDIMAVIFANYEFKPVPVKQPEPTEEPVETNPDEVEPDEEPVETEVVEEVVEEIVDTPSEKAEKKEDEPVWITYTAADIQPEDSGDQQ